MEKIRGWTEFEKIGRSLQKDAAVEWLAIGVPFIVFFLHALVFWSWIVDDAGISFAYARSLAQGYGLVAQPGSPPVEGFSNPLWTLLLAPLFAVGLFDPAITPKVISTFIILGSFIGVGKTLQKFLHVNRMLVFVVLLLLSINTSFVVWTTSGLENPLYVLLLSLLLLCSTRSVVSRQVSHPNGAIAGLLAAGVALTRPEGVIFFGIYPLVLLAKTIYNRDPLTKYPMSELAVYALCFCVVFGSYETFRWLYFGDLVANTYHSKGGPTLPDLLSILTLQKGTLTKLLGLQASVAGRFGAVSLLGLIIVTVYFVSAGGFGRQYLVLFLFLVWTVSAYLLLPADWMGEFRFATPFFVFFYSYGVILLHAFIHRFSLGSATRSLLSSLALIALICASAYMFAGRSEAFAQRPTVPFDSVARRFAFRFNDYANRLDIERASLLVPDVGGTLYYSDLKIYDLAGLTDRIVGRTLTQDRSRFYEYIFETVKPTFIHTHGTWTQRARFDDDERFRRDYIPIREDFDTGTQSGTNETRYSGDYVRRDVIHTHKVEVLAEIRDQMGR